MLDEHLPVKGGRITFHIIPLGNPFTAILYKELVQESCQLTGTPVKSSLPPLYHKHSVLFVIGEIPGQVITESGQVAGNSRHTAGHALQWGVAPGFIIAGEHTQMATSYKLAIIHSEEWIGRSDEVRVVDYFHFVLGAVQQILSRKKLKDIIIVFVHQFVRYHHRKPARLPALNGSAIPQFPIVIHKCVEIGRNARGESEVLDPF